MITLDYTVQNLDMCTGLPVGSPVVYHNPVCPTDCATTTAGLYVVQQIWDLSKCVLGPPVIPALCGVTLCPEIPYYCQVILNGFLDPSAILNRTWNLAFASASTAGSTCIITYVSSYRIGNQVVVVQATYGFNAVTGDLGIEVGGGVETSGVACSFRFFSTGALTIDCSHFNWVDLTLDNTSATTCSREGPGLTTCKSRMALGATICYPPADCSNPPPPDPCSTATLPPSFDVGISAPSCFGLSLSVNVPSVGMGIYQKTNYSFGGGLFVASIVITANVSGHLTLSINIYDAMNPGKPGCWSLFVDTAGNDPVCQTSSFTCGPPLSWTIVTTPVEGCTDYLPPNANPLGLQTTTGNCAALNACSGNVTINIVGGA